MLAPVRSFTGTSGTPARGGGSRTAPRAEAAGEPHCHGARALSQARVCSSAGGIRGRLRLPNDGGLWALIGVRTPEAGELGQSHRGVRRHLQLDPRNANSLYDLGGDTFRFLRRYPEAMEAYRRALTFTPDLSVARIGMGVALLWKGELGTLRASLDGMPLDEGLADLGTPNAQRARLLLWERKADSLLALVRNTKTPTFDSQHFLLPTALYVAWAYPVARRPPGGTDGVRFSPRPARFSPRKTSRRLACARRSRYGPGRHGKPSGGTPGGALAGAVGRLQGRCVCRHAGRRGSRPNPRAEQRGACCARRDRAVAGRDRRSASGDTLRLDPAGIRSARIRGSRRSCGSAAVNLGAADMRPPGRLFSGPWLGRPRPICSRTGLPRVLPATYKPLGSSR